MPQCSIEDIAVCLEEEILKPYAQECKVGMAAGISETMKAMVKETKQTAPKNQNPSGNRKAGTFAKAITHTAVDEGPAGFSETWHVKSPEYPLAHLLANGHALRQGGRAKGDPFLENAVSNAEAKLIPAITTKIT